MKNNTTLLFILLSFALCAQNARQQQRQEAANNSVSKVIDSDKATKAKAQNQQIRNRAMARHNDTPATRLRLANRGLSPNSLSYNYDGVRKEQVLFEKAGKSHLVLVDLQGYLTNDPSQPVLIAAGEQVRILRKKKKQYKVRYKRWTLFVDRVFYVGKREE